MSSEYESLARALLQSPQGVAVLKNMDKIQELAGKPESRKLIKLLSGKGGDALKSAAAAAAEGDKDMTMRLISGLLSTPEGAQLAKAIIDIM